LAAALAHVTPAVLDAAVACATAEQPAAEVGVVAVAGGLGAPVDFSRLGVTVRGAWPCSESLLTKK
jgi:hypothetical protein